jgi:nucleotide-binding universal stress UspA family protein
MTDPSSASPSPPPQPPARTRIFLVVADETAEMRVALRYAALRAFYTGGKVALLGVIEPPEVQQFAAIEERMAEEAREAAETLISRLATEVTEICGTVPIVHLREGTTREELTKLLDEEPGISILVLAAGTEQEGPGPLITALISRPEKLRVPITIVPGNLTNEQIAALA